MRSGRVPRWQNTFYFAFTLGADTTSYPRAAYNMVYYPFAPSTYMEYVRPSYYCFYQISQNIPRSPFCY